MPGLLYIIHQFVTLEGIRLDAPMSAKKALTLMRQHAMFFIRREGDEDWHSTPYACGMCVIPHYLAYFLGTFDPPSAVLDVL